MTLFDDYFAMTGLCHSLGIDGFNLERLGGPNWNFFWPRGYHNELISLDRRKLHENDRNIFQHLNKEKTRSELCKGQIGLIGP